MSKNNIVTFGLKNVHYAKATQGTDGAWSFTTPSKLAGAQEFTSDIIGGSTPVYADDQVVANSFVGDLKERKNIANRALVEKLCALGFEMDYDELLALTVDGYVNRAHIAADMLKRGYVESISEAFKGFLSERAGYYVPPKRMDFFEAVEFVSSLGAVSILAHPLLQLKPCELEELLPLAIERGLCAIETHYATYSSEQKAYSTALAHRLGLLESGGSDFHGENKPGQHIGIGRGDLCVPYEFYEKLKERAESLKK